MGPQPIVYHLDHTGKSLIGKFPDGSIVDVFDARQIISHAGPEHRRDGRFLPLAAIANRIEQGQRIPNLFSEEGHA